MHGYTVAQKDTPMVCLHKSATSDAAAGGEWYVKFTTKNTTHEVYGVTCQ